MALSRFLVRSHSEGWQGGQHQKGGSLMGLAASAALIRTDTAAPLPACVRRAQPAASAAGGSLARAGPSAQVTLANQWLMRASPGIN